ncbi:hypothetical protein DSECCO2_131700 [anaerobic digester metagenome]
MSVDKTPTGVVYTVTNGTAGQQYPLTFPYIKGADVKAYYVANGKQTVLTYGIQYTVEDQALTTLVALPVGAKLAIYRQTDLTQEIVWKDGQAVYTPDIMKADDKLTLIAQEIAADMSRTVKLTREEEAAGGKPEGVMQNIYGARDAAAASANVASNKAAEAADSAQAASEKADESAASAAASAQSAANASAASEGIAPRMDAVEIVAASAKAVTDLAAEMPGSGKIPVADSNGKLDAWISQQTQYATCATASATAAKDATLPGFSLVKGARVFVTFSNANTAAGALTLNVNGTGAKGIYNELGAVSSINPAKFPANVPIEFIYDVNARWTYRKYQEEFAKVFGGAPMYTCRAWVNFNGASNVPSIRSSGNVSSLTDNGVGDYTVNFATAMSHASYSTIATGSDTALPRPVPFCVKASTTNGVRLVQWYMTGTQGQGLYDGDINTVAIFC